MAEFTPVLMTDQELIEKLTSLQMKLPIASRMSYDAVIQIQNMINAISFELRDRMEKQMFQSRFGNSPESKELTVSDENSNTSSKEIAQRPKQDIVTGLRMKRTARPNTER